MTHEDKLVEFLIHIRDLIDKAVPININATFQQN